MFSYSLEYVPDRFKTHEMCNEAVKAGTWPWVLKYVPGQYITREMCSMVMCMEPWLLKIIPDRFKTQGSGPQCHTL